MNEQEMQQQFILWLRKKKGAATDDQVRSILQQLQADPEVMKQTMEEFQADMAGAQSVMRNGGKISYLECLKQFKKGGMMDCNCNKVARGESGIKTFRRGTTKQVPKGQLGMLASKAVTLAPKLAGLGKSAVKATLGQKAMGFIGANKNKIMGTAMKGMDALSSIKPKSDQQVITPSAKNNYYGANAGAIDSPTMKPLQRQVPVFTGNDIPPGGVTNTRLVEKGGKLKKKYLEGGILVAQRGEKLKGRALKNYREGENENSTIRKLHRADHIERRQDARAERRIAGRNQRLVDEFNYRGQEVEPGVYERPRNRFDEGAEAMIRAKKPLQASGTSVILPATRTPLPTIPDSSRGIEPLSTPKAAPTSPDYDAMSFGQALKAARAAQGSGVFKWRGKLQRISSLEEDEAAAKSTQQKSKGAAQSTTGQVAKQIRVPNPQYPGSTTIMPGTGIGEVEVTAPNLHKKATITPQEQEAIWKMREAKGLFEGPNAPSPEVIVRSGSVIPTPGYKPGVEGAPQQPISAEDIKLGQQLLKRSMYDEAGIMKDSWAKRSSGKAELTDSPIDYLAGPAGIEFLGTTVLKAAPRAIGMGATEAFVPRASIGAGQTAIGAGQTAIKAGEKLGTKALTAGKKALPPKTSSIREMLLRQ